MMASLTAWVVGNDRRFSAIMSATTIGLTVSAQYAYKFHPDRTTLGIVSIPELLLLPMIGPAILHAYVNRGLITTIALGTLAGFMQNIYLYAFNIDPPARSGIDSLIGAFTGTELLSIGIICGTVAFVLGVGLRVLVWAIHSLAQTSGTV